MTLFQLLQQHSGEKKAPSLVQRGSFTN